MLEYCTGRVPFFGLDDLHTIQRVFYKDEDPLNYALINYPD